MCATSMAVVKGQTLNCSKTYAHGWDLTSCTGSTAAWLAGSVRLSGREHSDYCGCCNVSTSKGLSGAIRHILTRDSLLACVRKQCPNDLAVGPTFVSEKPF